MIVKAGLLVDLGNSETRMTLVVNNRSQTTILSNSFMELQPSYRIPREYNNDKSSVICVDGVCFANGQIVEREFVNIGLRPSAIQYKTEQLTTKLSMHLVFLKAMLQLSEMFNVRLADLDVTFNVSVLLPPLEHEVNEGRMITFIKSMKSVKALVPIEAEINFNVNNVNVYPEGVAAFFSAFYTEDDGVLREVEENKEFASGYVLVLDIGAGTTDVVLIKDTELVQNSKDTFKRGGNMVESIVRNEIKKRFGFSPSDLKEVIAIGLLFEGVDKHDVTEILNLAKDSYSKSLMEDIRQYLERMMIEMREVKGILVIGGGSLPAVRDDMVVSPAMSEILLRYFKTLAPRVKLVSTNGINPRLMNIKGLELIHKYAG